MSAPTLLIATDLSAMRLVGERTDDAWSAPPAPADQPAGVGDLRVRAREAAKWVAARPAVRRRLAAVVLDVEETLCVWVVAASDAAPVVTAAARNVLSEWETAVAPPAVEPIRGPRRSDERKRPARRPGLGTEASADADAEADDDDPSAIPSGGAMAVLALPDALARLFLDELDKLGVRADAVRSLYHAAATWDAPDDGRRVATVLVEPDGRLVWSWSRGGRLLTGGSARLGPPDDDHTDAALRRVALDWLTWAGQLSGPPDVIRAIGADAERVAGVLRDAAGDPPVETVDAPDPIGATLRRAAAPPAPPADDGNLVLARLSGRATRDTRRRYQLAGAALLAAALAVGSVAFWLVTLTAEFRERALAERERAVDLVLENFPAANERNAQADPLRTARGLANQELDRLDVEPPPTPAPIFEETKRIAAILSSRPAEESAIRLDDLTLDQLLTNTVRFTTNDRSTTTALANEITGPGALIDWSAGRSSTPETRTLTGRWIEEQTP